MKRNAPAPLRQVLSADEVRDVLRATFYDDPSCGIPSPGNASEAPESAHQPTSPRPYRRPVGKPVAGGARQRRGSRRPQDAPESQAGTRNPVGRGAQAHRDYEVICISLYHDDLQALDAAVAELRARGHRKISRSALIRYALRGVDLEGVPRGL